VTDELESGVILTRDGVITASVSSESTNRETLRKMDQRNLSELAVVDSANQFVGVITQDEIVRKLLSSAVRAVQ
jgi:Mg/Co/Ni transporter MgtE